MASAATEREINKWRLWGVNRLLETNTSLVLVHEKTGKPPTLDLVKSIYYKDDEEAEDLLEEAKSSLRDMDMKWVILGACDFLTSCPLRTSKDYGNVLLRRSDVFRTFGKTESQGMSYTLKPVRPSRASGKSETLTTYQYLTLPRNIYRRS